MIPHLTEENFQKFKINRWGTNLSSTLAIAYQNSPFLAIKDLVNRDSRFRYIKRRGIEGYDMTEAPNNYWRNRKGHPTKEAKAVLLKVADIRAREWELDLSQPFDREVFFEVISRSAIESTVISKWGTTAKVVIKRGFNNETGKALQFLKRHYNRKFSQV